MRRYFAEFIQLPFLMENGNQTLEKSIEVIRQLDAQKIAKIPNDIDNNFINKQLVVAMQDQHGEIKRNLWEIGVAIAIKSGFRSGNLYIDINAKRAVNNITKQFHLSSIIASDRFKQDDFANISAGKLVLKKKDKIDIPSDAERLQTLIAFLYAQNQNRTIINRSRPYDGL